MGAARRPYVVRQGDYLAKIAARTGYTVDDLWNHPKNDPLRRAGRTEDVLYPGDIVHLPAGDPPMQGVNVGGENVYVGTVPRVPVRLVFLLGKEPRAGQSYEVAAAGETLATGAADGDGALSFDVPVDVMEVTVTFGDPFAVYTVLVGHVDPVRERSGVIGRLHQLGYLPRGAFASDEEVAGAVRAFQQDQKLPMTGEADGDTQDRLVKEFGS